MQCFSNIRYGSPVYDGMDAHSGKFACRSFPNLRNVDDGAVFYLLGDATELVCIKGMARVTHGQCLCGALFHQGRLVGNVID